MHKMIEIKHKTWALLSFTFSLGYLFQVEKQKYCYSNSNMTFPKGYTTHH